MKLIEPSRLTIDMVDFQNPDGLQVLRRLPIVRHFIPENSNPQLRVCSRIAFSNCVVESNQLRLGVKYKKVFDGIEYVFMPISSPEVLNIKDHERMYVCAVDVVRKLENK